MLSWSTLRPLLVTEENCQLSTSESWDHRAQGGFRKKDRFWKENTEKVKAADESPVTSSAWKHGSAPKFSSSLWHVFPQQQERNGSHCLQTHICAFIYSLKFNSRINTRGTLALICGHTQAQSRENFESPNMYVSGWSQTKLCSAFLIQLSHYTQVSSLRSV